MMSESAHMLTEEVPFEKFRKPAMLVEGIPILLALIGLISGFTQLTIIGFMLASAVYPFGGWYLFKAKEFTVWDIILATFWGLVLTICLIGILFYLMEWPGAREMLISARGTFYLVFILMAIFVIARNSKPDKRGYEFRYSQKILSRYLIVGLLVIFMG